MAEKTDFKRVALIGGSCSGKTTLVDEFSRRGFATIGEAALMVIEKLTMEMGIDGLANFRQTSLAALQLMIGQTQIEMEASSVSINGELVFCDGGLLDPIGYCTYFGVTPQNKLLELAMQHRYHRVFSLESLSTFVPRLKAGRISDSRSSFEIGILLRQVYRQHGYEPIEVPVMPVDERASYILEQLDKLSVCDGNSTSNGPATGGSINCEHLLGKSWQNKTVVDNRLPAPSRYDPLDYNP